MPSNSAPLASNTGHCLHYNLQADKVGADELFLGPDMHTFFYLPKCI